MTEKNMTKKTRRGANARRMRDARAKARYESRRNYLWD